MKNLVLFTSILFLSYCTNKRSVEYHEPSPYRDTLIDNLTGTKFYLDTAQIYIYAFAKSGELLWKTDPRKDNNLMEYRIKRPKIRFFEFKKDKWTDSIEVIGIGYDNSQFGYLDKKTGKFTFQGQD